MTQRRSEIDNFESTENLPFFPVCLFKVHVMAMHLSLLSPRVGGEQATHGKLTHRAFLWVGTLTLRCCPRVRNLTLPPSSKMERTWKWVSTMGVKSAQEKIQMVAKNRFLGSNMTHVPCGTTNLVQKNLGHHHAAPQMISPS